MKKILLAFAVIMTMGLASCGNRTEVTPDECVETTDSLELVTENDSLVVVEDTTVVAGTTVVE